MPFNGNTQLMKILDNKAAVAVLEKHFAGFIDHPNVESALNLSLNQISLHLGDVFSEIFGNIIQELERIEVDAEEDKVRFPDIMLSREDVIKAVERKNPPRIPINMGKWWGEGLLKQHGNRLRELERYPQDVVFLWIDPIPYNCMGLSWVLPQEGAHDNKAIVDDWAKLDEFIEKLPDPATDPQLDWLIDDADAAKAAGKYVIFGWWQLFFERPWSIRGMENIMMEYYLEPEKVTKLHKALLDHYTGYIRRAAKMFEPDGFWSSDDLGHQRGPMMSPKTFHEFLYPYYKRLNATLKETDIHFWLHSCGDNTALMEDLIDAGVDVFHPVQKLCMDEKDVAERFGDRITFLAGIDVQHTLQEKTPQGVREEVRFLIDTFDRADGGMCIGAGNGIVSGTPLENIEAFLDEALKYGEAHRR